MATTESSGSPEPAEVVVRTAAEAAAHAAAQIPEAGPTDIAAAAFAAAIAAVQEVAFKQDKLATAGADGDPPSPGGAAAAADKGVTSVLQLLVQSQQHTEALLLATQRQNADLQAAQLRAEERAVRRVELLLERISAAEAAAKPKEPEPEPFKVFVPHYEKTNPFGQRSKTVSLEPGLYEPHLDKTYDSLNGEKKSATFWEYYTLQATGSYLWDLLEHGRGHFPQLVARLRALEKLPTTAEYEEEYSGDEAADTLIEMQNSAEALYGNLINPRTCFLQFRAMLAPNGRVSEDKKLLLEAFADKLYGVLREELPANTDSYFKTVIDKWEKESAAQAIKRSAQKKAGLASSSPTIAMPGPSSAARRAAESRTAGGGCADTSGCDRMKMYVY